MNFNPASNLTPIQPPEIPCTFELCPIHPYESRRGIPFPVGDVEDSQNFSAFNELRRALYVYGYGPTKIQTLDKAASHYPVDQTILTIMSKIERDYRKNEYKCTIHSGSDIQGAFSQTNISVVFDRINNEAILYLSRSGTVNEEAKLAETLGMERAIQEMGVRITLPEMETQDLAVPLESRQTLRLDFAPFATMINSILKNMAQLDCPITPEEIVTALMSTDEYNNDLGEFVIDLGGGLCMVIHINGGSRFVYPANDTPKRWQDRIDTYTADGSTIKLPFLLMTYANEPFLDYRTPPQPIQTYTISIKIRRSSQDKYSTLPIRKRRRIQRAHEIIEHIQCNIPSLGLFP